MENVENVNNVDSRLGTMTTIIVSMVTERFGVEEQR